MARKYRRSKKNRLARRARRNNRRKKGILNPRTLFLTPKTSVCVQLRKIELINSELPFATNSLEFVLQDFLQYQTWTNIFESYRIRLIKQVYYPQQDSFGANRINISSDVAVTADQFNEVYMETPLLLMRTERDGEGSAPANVEDCLKNPAYNVQHMKRKSIMVKWKPNTLTPAYHSSLTGTSYTAAYDKFISTADTTVEYYGRRRAISVPGADANLAFNCRVITTAIVEFKNMKYEENT